MLRFVLVDDEKVPYLQVIQDNRMIGTISDRGFGPSLQDGGYRLEQDDLDAITKKFFEFKHYPDTPICSNCGGTPLFPKFVEKVSGVSVVCPWGIHVNSRLTI